MRAVAAVVETSHDQLVANVRAAFRAYGEAEKSFQQRRLELGQALTKLRIAWPKRGPKAKGWGDFLAKEGINEDVALTAMKYAGWVETHVDEVSLQRQGNLPTLREAGLRGEPSNESQEPEVTDEEPEVEIDRDTWCTPKDIARAIGRWDLDPCSNERSHIDAVRMFRLDLGEDGLKLASAISKTARVFINPPYSDVRPWIDAYHHARFCFLLKFDPSTKWFAELMRHSRFVLFPRGTRVEFEPPPGVPPDKSHANPFPHALFYAREADATDAIRALCFPGWIINRGK